MHVSVLIIFPVNSTYIYWRVYSTNHLRIHNVQLMLQLYSGIVYTIYTLNLIYLCVDVCIVDAYLHGNNKRYFPVQYRGKRHCLL